MIFRDRAGLLRDLEDTVQFLAQCRYIPADLVIGDLGVDLGRGDPFVPQHLADRFQRHALRKRDRRGKGMTRHVENTFHLRNWKNIENKLVTGCELADFLYSASVIGRQFGTEY